MEMNESMPVLEVNHLHKTFDGKHEEVHAVKDVSFRIGKNECLGLIGESGSGKSTIAGIVAGLVPESSGMISYHGEILSGKSRKEQDRLTRNMQMVFQNPRATFNPRQRIADGVAEGIRYYEKLPVKELRSKACYYLELAGLPAEYGRKFAWQLSGGECQRAAIARALISEPDFLICDEITSALDVSVQKVILEILTELRRERKMSILFISHDLAVVSQFCDRVMVLCQGEVVEEGTVQKILEHPEKYYTRQLINAVYDTDPYKNEIKKRHKLVP